jgi:hypothetical protein
MTNDRLNETLALVDELVQAVTIASHDLSGVMEKRRAKEASNDLRIAIAKLCNAPEPGECTCQKWCPVHDDPPSEKSSDGR